MADECGKKILLVGNPNTGKTTLFNKLTQSNEHVGNWHGVTVEEKAKSIKYDGKCFSIVDLPGIYSLKSLSYEEEVAVRYILSHKDCKIINICDENNLERNLFLTLCLLEKGLDVVLAVNSTLKKPICKCDVKNLSNDLGISVVRVNAKTGEGFDALMKEASLPCKMEKICEGEDKDMLTDASEKYKRIEELLEKTCKRKKAVYGKSKLDKILLNRFCAPFIFLGIMATIFYLTFFLIGSPLSTLLSNLLSSTLGVLLDNLFSSCFGANNPVTLLVNEALIGGIGTILSFLPQIVLLFFFLAVLEDSGYLSRVAFVFDDLLSTVGLSGRSVYTLLLGFGCSASAILTARNMDDKKAKLKTVLVTPFLSCSARLPIYLAIGGAFFGSRNIFVIMFLYGLGIVVAILASLILNKTCLKSRQQSFLLEFPPYRGVSLKRAGKILWDNVKSFVFRIGGLLISMNVVVWLLSNLSFSFKFVGAGGGSMLESIAKVIAPIFLPLGFSSWGLIVALLVGLVAKEGVLTSMALLCGGNLAEGLFLQGGVIGFSSPASVLSFLAFCLLYVPCISTLAVMRKEIGKNWTFFAIIMQLLTAYLMSMVVFWVTKFAENVGFVKVFLIMLIILVCVISAIKIFAFRKNKGCFGCKHCRK